MKTNKNMSVVGISILVFLLYFIWPYLADNIMAYLNVDSSYYACLKFIWNFILLFILLFIYRKYLKKDILDFKKNSSKYMIKGIKILVIGLVCYVFANLLVGVLCSFSGNQNDNFNVMYDTFKAMPMLLIITTIVYYPIVEEIVFKKTFKDIISNKWLFVIITGLLNAGFNIALSTSSSLSLLYIIPDAIISMSFSYIYYETNNLTTSVLYRSLYNLIPNIAAILSFIVIM